MWLTDTQADGGLDGQTDGQIDRQTNKWWQKHNFLCEGNNTLIF